MLGEASHASDNMNKRKIEIPDQHDLKKLKPEKLAILNQRRAIKKLMEEFPMENLMSDSEDDSSNDSNYNNNSNTNNSSNNMMDTNNKVGTTDTITTGSVATHVNRPALNSNMNNKQPPILIKLSKNLNLNKIVSDINKITSKINIKFTSQHMILNNVLKESIAELNNLLKANNLEYFTYTAKEDKVFKFVLKGLPNLEVDAVKEDISQKGIEIVKIAKMKSNTSNTFFANYFVSVKDLNQAQNLTKLRAINNILVKFERYENRSGITQCYNCQDYGHGSANCNIKSRCVKCAGYHTTATCTKTPEEKPKCANCNLEHVANYSGCETRQNHQINRQIKKQLNINNKLIYNNRFDLLVDNESFPEFQPQPTKSKQNTRTNNSSTNNNSNKQNLAQLKQQEIKKIKMQINEHNKQLQQLYNTTSYADVARSSSQGTVNTTPTSFKSTNSSSQQSPQTQQPQMQQHQPQHQEQQGESFSDLLKLLIGFMKDFKSIFGSDLSQLINKIKTFLNALKSGQGNKLEIALEFIMSLFNE